MMTPHAKISCELSDLCRKIDSSGTSIFWTAKNRVSAVILECSEDGTLPDFGPVEWLSIGLAKIYRERPQDIADIIQLKLGWRLYRNIHDKSRVAWGYPPKCLGGEGNGWTWKAAETDFGAVLRKILEK